MSLLQIIMIWNIPEEKNIINIRFMYFYIIFVHFFVIRKNNEKSI